MSKATPERPHYDEFCTFANEATSNRISKNSSKFIVLRPILVSISTLKTMLFGHRLDIVREMSPWWMLNLPHSHWHCLRLNWSFPSLPIGWCRSTALRSEPRARERGHEKALISLSSSTSRSTSYYRNALKFLFLRSKLDIFYCLIPTFCWDEGQ